MEFFTLTMPLFGILLMLISIATALDKMVKHLDNIRYEIKRRNDKDKN